MTLTDTGEIADRSGFPAQTAVLQPSFVDFQNPPEQKAAIGD
jgi:hypothetical protein